MSKQVLLSVFAEKLRYDYDFVYSFHDCDALVKAVVLSGTVPVFARECRIDQRMTPDTRVDVLRGHISIPVGVDPPLGGWGLALTRFKVFEFVCVDEGPPPAYWRRPKDPLD